MIFKCRYCGSEELCGDCFDCTGEETSEPFCDCDGDISMCDNCMAVFNNVTDDIQAIIERVERKYADTLSKKQVYDIIIAMLRGE